MPNHYHLLIEIGEPEKISSIMAGIGRAYVYYYHRRYKSCGHIWAGRFKSQAIQKEMYLLACGRYIERNSVKVELVRFAEEYDYSSAGYHVYGREDKVTTKNPLFGTFGKDITQRRGGYRQFLENFDLEEERLFENLEKPQGSKEFVNRLVKEKGLYIRDHKIVPIVLLRKAKQWGWMEIGCSPRCRAPRYPAPRCEAVFRPSLPAGRQGNSGL